MLETCITLEFPSSRLRVKLTKHHSGTMGVFKLWYQIHPCKGLPLVVKALVNRHREHRECIAPVSVAGRWARGKYEQEYMPFHQVGAWWMRSVQSDSPVIVKWASHILVHRSACISQSTLDQSKVFQADAVRDQVYHLCLFRGIVSLLWTCRLFPLWIIWIECCSMLKKLHCWSELLLPKAWHHLCGYFSSLQNQKQGKLVDWRIQRSVQKMGRSVIGF